MKTGTTDISKVMKQYVVTVFLKVIEMAEVDVWGGSSKSQIGPFSQSSSWRNPSCLQVCRRYDQNSFLYTFDLTWLLRRSWGPLGFGALQCGCNMYMQVQPAPVYDCHQYIFKIRYKKGIIFIFQKATWLYLKVGNATIVHS